jgi:protoporphyrinogen oxidase/putative flippase GtrA
MIPAFIKKHIKLIRYFFIGISASVIDVGIFWLLIDIFKLNALLSTSISIFVATVWAFLINSYYNFNVTDSPLKRFLSYSVVSAVGLVISLVALEIFAEHFGFNAKLVKIISLPFIFVVQYLLNKHFTFKKKVEATTTKSVTATVSSSDTVFPKGIERIGIIGSGLTGLTAAYELSKKGHEVTIFEFQNHVGGLASNFDLGGYPIERAYHFLYQSDEHMLTLAKELGISDAIKFYPSSIRYFHEGVDYPFMTPKDLLTFKPLSFINRVRLGVLSLYLKQLKNWQPLSHVTAYAWLSKWMGEEVTREIWEPLLRGKFNHYYDKITMSWLWGRFNIRARSQNKDFSGEKLGYPEGGFSIITDALVYELKKRQVAIKLNTGVRTISVTENTGEVIIETLTGNTYTFDKVLATVPSPVFAKMIAHNASVPKTYIDRLLSIDYLDAVVMVFRTTQRLTNAFWYNIKDVRVPFLTLLSPSALAGTKQWNGSEVYFVGAYVPHDHSYMAESYDIETEWKKGLSVMFPQFDEAQIQELKISKFKDAQHIVDVGFEDNKLVPFTSPLNDVYLANFSQIYPDDRGTNFAVRDGIKVATLMCGK